MLTYVLFVECVVTKSNKAITVYESVLSYIPKPKILFNQV